MVYYAVVVNWNSESPYDAVCEGSTFLTQSKAEKEQKVDLGEYTEDNQHNPLKSLLYGKARKSFISSKRKPKPGTQELPGSCYPCFHYHLQKLSFCDLSYWLYWILCSSFYTLCCFFLLRRYDFSSRIFFSYLFYLSILSLAFRLLVENSIHISFF